ncbi:photosystem I subunit O-like [Impatiens glandulifera]|uniref:photosystem I subunit O-like n=1 Tax=Impatiens glandulifera TaxID=253017 RepID=UPI001FB1889E|nr:photosystem I subunit O-like [Impatiens glandulifera]
MVMFIQGLIVSLSAQHFAKVRLSSGFLKAPVKAINPLMVAKASGGNFERNWKDLNVIGFGLIGWLAPSSIPAINDNSLTGLFFSSIGTELAHFPTGPALTWHMRLFLALTFGQIGFKSRTEDYFNKIN